MIASTMKIHLVLCLFLMGFCSSINFLMVTGNCLPHQQSLLLQLHTNLVFDSIGSKKLVRWNQSEDCCEWDGVTCQMGRVTSLDLSEEGIYGVNDNLTSLFSLQHLQSLNLACNFFHSEIPSGFHNLSNLRHLNLSLAGFLGKIPVEISKLTSLVTLDLSSLDLYLDNPNLQMLVQNMTYMTKLVLHGTKISALGNGWSQTLSSSMPNLQLLDLSLCQLSGTIDSSWENFNNLTVLDLSMNNLFGWFPENIFQLKRLKFLDVSYNTHLDGSLPEVLKNRSLQTLRMAYTNFSGPIPDSISNLRYLSDLDISFCHFNGTPPSSMSKFMELTHLDMSSNQLTGPIPSFNLSMKLIHIDLSYNVFNGKIPSTHFQGLSNLAVIKLLGNSFKGSIPSSLFTLPILQQVILGYNEFNGQLNNLANNSRIQELDVRSNQLEGPISSSLFNLTELKFLYLSSNKFSGKIEMNKIQQLQNLKELDLSSNKFSGNIELNMIHLLQNLTYLDLSHNNFSCTDTSTTYSSSSFLPRINILGLASCGLTTFPRFLHNQSEIYDLNLSDNNIHGIIPIWIWNNTSLINLDLSENYLTDCEETPHSNTSYLLFLDLHSNNLQRSLLALFLPSIFYLDYSNNNISSIYPSDIDHRLSGIRYLFLSSNRFQGSIPKSLCNIKSLEVLELSNNSLTGTIPKCLIAMKELRVLKLRSNKLIDRIDTFPSSCNLQTLDVNGNFLQGRFPEYLENCSRLEILDLGNNQINDKFFCRLENISTLRILILRSNKLHGSIECPSAQAAWPKLQILDLAMNNLSGSMPPAIFKNWKAMMADDKVTQTYLLRNISSVVKTYYDGRVIITIKGQQFELQKILTKLTCVDLSSNKFEGPIPEEIGELKALHILNLSHNAFLGHIPSSLGNLKNLESLDLSNNSLRGQIPTQLASVSFLSFLDVSNNNLVGRIPTGTQLQSFNATFFEGNDGLCGPPLTDNCSGDGVQRKSPPWSEKSHSSMDWNFISAELGFAFGIGMIILPLIFWKRWRLWYCEQVDAILYRIFPQLDFAYEQHGGKNYRTLRWKPC